MTKDAFINILIAEDNDVSRDMMAGILKTQGYNAIHARDGGEAIQKLNETRIDLALVDINMAPHGGFEFVRHLVVKGLDIPVVVITGDDSTDTLIEAGNLGITRVMQKPVDPEQLNKIVAHILKRRGINPHPMGVETHDGSHPPEGLMQKAIALAQRNIDTKKGRPFGAIVSDKDGKIIGEGANRISSRVDPTAHAEVMAIRQAAERLGVTSLSDCTLYCSSEPTKIGQALIESVGIQTVYYGLSHADIGKINTQENSEKPSYKRLCEDEARAMFKGWKQG